MQDILNEIQQGLSGNLYYLSLFVALLLPDVCGAMNSQDGKASSARYEEWFNKYIAPKYNKKLTGSDCYLFRCSLLHQGSTQHPKSSYSKILFIEPSATTNIFHNNILNDALNIDVRIFCNDLIDGVTRWLREVDTTTLYKANYKKFIKRYPNGLSPYIKGVSVIG